MGDIAGMIENSVNAMIKSKIDALNFDSMFKDKITPKLEASVETGVKKLFDSYSFQEKAADMFNRDIFKIYDEALTDCAVVKNVIDDAKDEKSSALTEFITTIKTANNDDKIKVAKDKFLKKMSEINTKLNGESQSGGIGSSELKRLFKDKADKMNLSPPSQATAVGGNNLITILDKIQKKTQEASDEIRRGKEGLKTRTTKGGKSKKTYGGSSFKINKRSGKSKRRKQTYKRR